MKDASNNILGLIYRQYSIYLVAKI